MLRRKLEEEARAGNTPPLSNSNLLHGYVCGQKQDVYVWCTLK